MDDRKIMALAYRYFKRGMIICIIAILVSPFLPWVGVINDDEEEGTEVRFLSEGTIHIYGGISYGTFDAYEDLSDNIGWVTIFLWLTLIFLMLGYLGTVFYYVGRKFEIPAKILVLIGCFALIFAILCVIFNGLCFMNVMELQDAYRDNYGDSSTGPQIFLGYNYVPLVASIIIMFIGILLIFRVFQPTLRSIRSHIYYYQVQQYHSGPYGGAPPPGPPPPVEGPKCTNCGAIISAGMVYCSKCGLRTDRAGSPSENRDKQAARTTVYKCPQCRAIIMDPSNCPYCGWNNLRY